MTLQKYQMIGKEIANHTANFNNYKQYLSDTFYGQEYWTQLQLGTGVHFFQQVSTTTNSGFHKSFTMNFEFIKQVKSIVTPAASRIFAHISLVTGNVILCKVDTYHTRVIERLWKQ